MLHSITNAWLKKIFILREKILIKNSAGEQKTITKIN